MDIVASLELGRDFCFGLRHVNDLDTNRLKLWEVCGLVISGSDTYLQVKALKQQKQRKQN